jgi:hypothetical protein
MLAADTNFVGFDVPSLVIVQEMSSESTLVPTTGGKLVRIRMPVSMFVSSEFRGVVHEWLVELESPQQTIRVVDFWPRQEVYSDIEGTVQVERSYKRDAEFSFTASGGFEPFARGTAGGKLDNNTSTQERFLRKPPVQVLTSSGTIRRGYGVFFKFLPGPTPNPEGIREIAVLAEVPLGWRADMLRVSLSATGSLTRGGRDTVALGDMQLWTTLHLEGDRRAAERATMYLMCERNLRQLAAANHERVMQKALPTLWHKVGVALDVVEPRIQIDYLQQVLFGPSAKALDSHYQRLPVDLRVAILDFWDARDALLELGQATPVRSSMAASQWTWSSAIN